MANGMATICGVFVIVLLVIEVNTQGCDYDEFPCSNGDCIDSDLVCNDYNECGDNSDERSCEDCNAGTFSCGRNYDGYTQCIFPHWVCDKQCDCWDCRDEDGCYSRRGTLYAGSIGGVVVAIIFILLVMMLCYLGRYKLKIIKKPDRDRTRISTISGQTELQDIPDVANRNRRNSAPPNIARNRTNSTPPDIVSDLPPSYQTVVDNPVFDMDSESLKGDSDDFLPTYEEANSTLQSSAMPKSNDALQNSSFSTRDETDNFPETVI